jgi:hypothetical protein
MRRDPGQNGWNIAEQRFQQQLTVNRRIAPVINTAMNKLRKLLLSITLLIASISFCVKIPA